MQIKDYVKPELLVVAVVLYFIGMWLKQSETVKDKYIPLINGLIGVAICAIYVFATCACGSGQDIALGSDLLLYLSRQKPGEHESRKC